jgi:hypothetical protein
VAFGQLIGSPASAKQVQRLRALLEAAGYDGFRSARGPLRLTQRQGLGKFTNTEAEALIGQLEHETEDPSVDDIEPNAPDLVTPSPLRDTPTDLLITELRRRGWSVTKH